MAQQGRKRDDRKDGKNEQQRMRLRPDPLDDEHDRHKREQPQQRLVPDLFHQDVHGRPPWPCTRRIRASFYGRAASLDASDFCIESWKATISVAVDAPIISAPLIASSGPSSRWRTDITMSP